MLQSKLLTILQERFYTRVGGTERLQVDARILAATNEDLESAIMKGRFRKDLYYRLNVVSLLLPPLRHRREDIPLLAQQFLAQILHRTGSSIKSVEPGFFELLESYDWPGNIRELQNALESACLFCGNETLSIADLPLSINASTKAVSDLWLPRKRAADPEEKEKIVAALKKCNGHREKTAQMLGISRRTLQYKLKYWNLL